MNLVFLPVDFLRNLFSSTLGLGSAEKVLDELTLDGVVRYIKSGKCECFPASSQPIHYGISHNGLIYCSQVGYYLWSHKLLSIQTGKNILCMVGAGISTCEYIHFNITFSFVINTCLYNLHQ